jgi:superoxide dismutase
MSFNLPKLPYAYNALEPYIDARTMEIHYTKHHKAYTDNLNNAITGTELEGKSIEDILLNLDPENKAVRNNGGGYYNHNLFWKILTPNKGMTPSKELSEAIDKAFGSFKAFKEIFSKAAATQFGSGWAWLTVHKGGKIEVCATANQDNPLMPHIQCGSPILGIDVWEHAYYLNYQNRRADYIEAFFNVINWNKVSELYHKNK